MQYMMRLLLSAGLVSKAAGIAVVTPPFFSGIQPSSPPTQASFFHTTPRPPVVAQSWPTVWSVKSDAKPCSGEELADKTYDVLLFGGTGNVGRAVVDDLLEKRVGDADPKWAVVVRNANLFKYKLAEKYGESKVNSINVIEADIHLNQELLMPLIRQAKVILNLVGPYEDAGSEFLVSTAIISCTHYVDAATEGKWKRYIKEQYGLPAQLRELSIVQGAGFESAVADLAAMSAASDLVKSGVPAPTQVTTVWDLANSLADGAKFRSEQAAIMRYGWVMDPYVLAPETPEALRVDKVVDGWGEKRHWDPVLNVTLVPYGHGKVDPLVVRRSMNLEFPDKAISVQEACTYRMQESLRQFRLSANVTAPLAPGEVPAARALEQGSFLVRAVAVYQPPGNSGSETIPYTTVTVEGLGDPQIVASSKIALQLALGLVYERDRRSGYVTPATVLGTERLEKRLTQLDGGRFMRVIRD